MMTAIAHQRAIDQLDRESLYQERWDQRAEKIIDGFDKKDVMAMIDLIADKNPDLMYRLYDAMSIIPSLNTYKIEDQRFARIAQAFKDAAWYYAGYVASQERAA